MLVEEMESQYDHLLLQPREQLELLWERCRKWRSRSDPYLHRQAIPLQWFSQVDVSGWRDQRLSDAWIVHLEGFDTAHTVQFWRDLIAPEYQNLAHWNMLSVENVRRHPATRAYPPGIHLVRVNMTAQTWLGKTADELGSIRRLWEAAQGGDLTLAHAEVFAAYGLHPELMSNQDGKELPYVYAGGYQTTNERGDYDWTVLLKHDRHWTSTGVYKVMGFYRIGGLSRAVAVPTILT